MDVLAVQFDVAWEQPEENFRTVDHLLDIAQPPAGAMIVLPEMFATGFSMNTEVTLPAAGSTVEFLSAQARKRDVFLFGGLAARREDGRAENQALLVAPDGSEIGRFSKLHPFTFAGEDSAHAPGLSLEIAGAGGFCVAAAICYDLRFPELFRQAARRGAELFLVPANWPAVRGGHWRCLLQARAIENQAFVVGVNRTGSDPAHAYGGGSEIVAPDGQRLASAGADQEVISAHLDGEMLKSLREDFPVLRDVRDDLLGP